MRELDLGGRGGYSEPSFNYDLALAADARPAQGAYTCTPARPSAEEIVSPGGLAGIFIFSVDRIIEANFYRLPSLINASMFRGASHTADRIRYSNEVLDA